MKVAPSAVASLLREPDPDIGAVLIYGPDEGLVRERSDQLARAVVGDLADPFRYAELAPAALRDEPALLWDEAAALSLTGGRRVVRIRGATDAVADTMASFVGDEDGGALVIVEAGDLAPRSRLRRAFEQAGTAGCIACYGDEGRVLDDVIRDTLARHGVVADPDATRYLRENLGGDRMISRSELEKLALYAGDNGRVTLEDASACVGDSAAMTLDDIAFAAASGDQATLSRAIDRACQEGTSPVAILRVVCRHFQRLQLAAARAAAGESFDSAMKSLRPPVFFKRAGEFRAQLGRWPAADLAHALEVLTEAEIACKTTGTPAEAVCGRALMRLAGRAGAASRGG